MGAGFVYWRRIRVRRGVADITPAPCGVLLQFPFDAMIVGDPGTGLSESLTHLFATVTSHSNFAVLVGVYLPDWSVHFLGRKQVGRGSVLRHGSCNRQSRAP